MAAEAAALSFSVASVVEDVLLQQHGARRDVDLESRRAEEAALRRNSSAGWLRKMIGVVAARDLPAEPTEEEFRLGLRSGIILCNVLNKVQPGAVQKVVEGPCDSAVIPDGAALSAFQYFENVRNFLVAIQEKGIPTFEASDLEQGGKTSRVVNCVLALKSLGEWKQTGGSGVWKFGGNVKPSTSTQSFVRKNPDPFTNSLSRTSSMNEKSLGALALSDSNKMPGSLSMLVRAVLLDKKPEEVPSLVESVLSKVMEEFENRIVHQYEQRKISANDAATGPGSRALLKPTSNDKKTEEKNIKSFKKEESITKSNITNEESRGILLKQKMSFNEQQCNINDIKNDLYTTKAGMQFMQMKFHEELNNLAIHVHGLANAASGYHRVLEENCKLYNQVQDLKGSIRVYCRVRPFLSGQPNYMSTVGNIEEGTITINGKGHRSFNFNKIFGASASQAEVFADTQPLIRSVLDGYNVCMFAYGQTGSGKTYTMTGPKQLTEQSQGVNYRALSDLFFLAEQRKDAFRYDVAVQMIEIYNEQVRDLLVSDGSNKRLEIRNNSQTGLSVPDACLVPVSSTPAVLELMNLGQRNRAVGATALNDRSSRSHSCLTVHVQGRNLTSGAILRGCMHLVDLAGSERVDKSEVTGDRLKEAQHINRSLSALGDVISSLAQKNSHVPYRNSKLTQLLQDSLGGQAKTLMFVHISPEPDAIGETISTLKFAERVATVELGAARVNKDSSGDVKELKEQIASLKAALARKEEEPKYTPHSTSMNSEQHRKKAADSSPFNCNQLNFDAKLTGDVGNIEKVCKPKQKRLSFDLDELLGNSPPWPLVPGQSYRDDEKEIGLGEWEDKVMMVNNKQDGCWDPDNGNLSNMFYNKYLKDSPKILPEQKYNTMFMGTNGFNVTTTDDVDDLDATTSDSSEQGLLWQFNHSKPNVMAHGIGLKATKSLPKPAKNTDLRNLNYSNQGPSPSRKPSNGSGLPLHQTGRLPHGADDKTRNDLEPPLQSAIYKGFLAGTKTIAP